MMNDSFFWRIGEILVKNDWLKWENLEAGLQMQKNTGRLLGEILKEKGYLSSTQLYRALAYQFGMPYVDLRSVTPDPSLLYLIPRHFALKYEIMPISLNDSVLMVAICDPLKVWNDQIIQELTKVPEIHCALTTPESMAHALKLYYALVA